MNIHCIAKAVLIFGFLAAGLGSAIAHDRFILPSHTVLSGDAKSVSMIASISNDMFHPDRAFGDNGKGAVEPALRDLFSRLEATVIQPDGRVVREEIWQAFARFSAADLALADSGSYRVVLAQPRTMLTTFRKADGSPGRVFGPDANPPEGAVDIVRRTSMSRVETFITRNGPTRAALKPVGSGLELGGATHPNDLFVNETAAFQLFFDGQPLKKPAKLSLVRGGTRHRNQREAIELETDAGGRFKVVFPEPGFYLLHAQASFPADASEDVDIHNASLFVTLEVFPE